MAAVKELIRAEEDGSISFGDYELASKTKKQDFEYQGEGGASLASFKLE